MTASALKFECEALPARRNSQRRYFRLPGTKRDPLEKKPCMNCGRPFASDGKFNRLCGPCKEGDRYSLG